MAMKQSRLITISLGSSVYKNDIVQKEISIAQLFKRLSTPAEQLKKDGKYFIFASFTKNVRTAKNIKEHFGATIDLDDTPLSISDIRKVFAKYRHCIYTTYNHVVKGDRYRLVLPYKAPIDTATHTETMLYLMNLLGATNVDLSSKALSRPMYLPSVHPKRKDDFVFTKNTNGFLFNPNSQKIRGKVAELHFAQDEISDVHEPFNINDNVDEGGRNDALSQYVGKIIHLGTSVENARGMAQSWNTAQLSPPLSSKEVTTIVNSIVNAHKRNHNDLAWGYDEIISRIKRTKNVASDYEHILDMTVAAKVKQKLKPHQLQLIINTLNAQAKVGKRAIVQEISTKELELIGKLEESKDENFESAAKAFKKDFKEWVYVATDDRLFNLKTGEYFKREAFSAMYTSPNVEGSLFNMLTRHSLIKKVSRLEFDPSMDEIYIRNNIRHGNTYIAPDIFPLPGDVSRVIKHFEYLIPEEYERNIVLDFIAHIVQKPGVKIRWMPIIKGGKGIGKTIIAEKIILPLIGFSNFGKVSNEVIRSDFNAWQLDKQLVVFEELDIGGNQKEKEQLTESLKAFITDNILTAHRKGLDPYDTINKANALGFTNKEDAIIITVDERRFCMIRTDVRPKGDRYYTSLAEFTDKHIPELYHFFMERDLSKFSAQRAPDTAYTNEVKSMSVSWPGSIVSTWLHDDHHALYASGCATHGQIVDCIRAESSGRFRAIAEDLQNVGSAQAKKLYYVLRNLGFVKYKNPKTQDGRIRIKGKPENVWLFPFAAEELTNATTKSIARRIGNIKIRDENWAHD